MQRLTLVILSVKGRIKDCRVYLVLLRAMVEEIESTEGVG